MVRKRLESCGISHFLLTNSKAGSDTIRSSKALNEFEVPGPPRIHLKEPEDKAHFIIKFLSMR